MSLSELRLFYSLVDSMMKSMMKRQGMFIDCRTTDSQIYNKVFTESVVVHESVADPGFLEGGFKSIKRGFVFNILPDFFIIFPMNLK